MPDTWKLKSKDKLKSFDLLKWLYTRILKVEKLIESKMFRCLEIALYQSSVSRERSRKAKEVSLQIRTSAPCVCVHLGRLRLSLTLTILSFCLWKGKEKRQILISYIRVTVFLCNATAHPALIFYSKFALSITGAAQCSPCYIIAFYPCATQS